MHLIAPAQWGGAETRADLLHEAFHSGTEKLIGSKAWMKLLKRLDRLYRDSRASKGRNREFFDTARANIAHAQRAERAAGLRPMSRELTAEEMGAYAITHYEVAPKVWRDWVDKLIGEIKAWLQRRFGIQAGQVTPAQLRALALAALRAEARTVQAQPSANLQKVAGAGARFVARPNEPTFYSAVLRAVEDSTTKRASPAQWLATIKATPGVKQEELDWIGLADWLATATRPGENRPASVSRDDLLDFIRANQLNVSESILSEQPPPPTDEEASAVTHWAFSQLSEDEQAEAVDYMVEWEETGMTPDKWKVRPPVQRPGRLLLRCRRGDEHGHVRPQRPAKRRRP
jgi:hypothetical protein